ncbi:MAG: hypothetical protein WA737_16455 [Candidatus Acidiferrales bacterium]
MSLSDALQAKLSRLQRGFFSVGILALLLGAFLGLRSPDASAQFMHSYLFAYIYWIAFPLGAMALLMTHHLSGGWWGRPLQRPFEAASRTIVLMALLVIPILLKIHTLYAAWATPGALVDDTVGHFKFIYLQPHAFVIRAIIYFALLILFVAGLSGWSRELDRTGNPALQERMRAFSGPMLVFWSFILTLAMVDWVMSLEPHWFSTIYGMLFIVIDCLAALAGVIFLLTWLWDEEPIKGSMTEKRLIDLGSLLLAFVMLWAYLSFDQFLIIWAGNLKDEIPWYMTRAFGPWGVIAAVLIALHFFVPFFLLLFRGVKRRIARLSKVALWILALTVVDIYWLVCPSFRTPAGAPVGPGIHPSDILAFVGIGGLWLGAFIWQLRRAPLLPLHDPRFEGVLLHEHGD